MTSFICCLNRTQKYIFFLFTYETSSEFDLNGETLSTVLQATNMVSQCDKIRFLLCGLVFNPFVPNFCKIDIWEVFNLLNNFMLADMGQ
jgi:hypothetical protein